MPTLGGFPVAYRCIRLSEARPPCLRFQTKRPSPLVSRFHALQRTPDSETRPYRLNAASC